MLAHMIDEKTNPKKTVRSREGYCPCCGAYTTFTEAGIQKIPARVAAATGLPENVQLWTCSQCKSTISETELRF